MKEDIIFRNRYYDKIEPFIGKQIIKVLTGQRRTGKSFILKQLMSRLKDIDAEANIIYINMENLEFVQIKTALDLNEYIKQHTKSNVRNYIFIDEIQEIKEFEKALRSLQLDPVYDIFCTGSNANILSGEFATFLSGRYIEFPVYSLSFNEFIQFHKLDNNNSSLTKYLHYGGLPYLKHLQLEDNIVYDYLKGVYNTIIYKDIIVRNDVRNTAFLESLVTFLAGNTGQLFSAKRISDYLKSQQVNISTSQIINYLRHITNAFLIHNVKRMNISGKKVFDIGEKFYFEDVGLRNTICGYRQTDIGKIIENAVFKHLLYNDYDVRAGQTGNHEIDFIGSKKGEKIYIQVCYLLQEENTIKREFGNLEKINDNYPKYVVSMDEFEGNTHNGIIHIYLRDFLSNPI
jgi:Predicted ATPase (AAA+ superfamily)